MTKFSISGYIYYYVLMLMLKLQMIKKMLTFVCIYNTFIVTNGNIALLFIAK